MLRNALRNSNETVFVAAEAVEPECRCVPFLFVCKESNVEKVHDMLVLRLQAELRLESYTDSLYMGYLRVVFLCEGGAQGF